MKSACMTRSSSKVPTNTHTGYAVCLFVCPCRFDPRQQTGAAHLSAGSNACRVNNGGCSSLCLATPGGRQCGCADDQILDPADNTSCKGACTGGQMTDGKRSSKIGFCWTFDHDSFTNAAPFTSSFHVLMSKNAGPECFAAAGPALTLCCLL